MRLKPDMVTFKCDYCQNVFAPAPDDEGVCVLGETCAQDCPLCSIPLEHATIAKTRIRYCTKCKGMLVPMEIVASLVEDLRAGLTTTVIPPPSCFTIPYTVARPSPVPLPGSFVVKNGSNTCASVASFIPAPVSVTSSIA